MAAREVLVTWISHYGRAVVAQTLPIRQPINNSSSNSHWTANPSERNGMRSAHAMQRTNIYKVFRCVVQHFAGSLTTQQVALRYVLINLCFRSFFNFRMTY